MKITSKARRELRKGPNGRRSLAQIARMLGVSLADVRKLYGVGR